MSHHLSRKHKKRSNYRRKSKIRKSIKKTLSKKKNKGSSNRRKKIIYSNVKLRGKGIKNEKISFLKTKTKSLCSELDYNSCSKVRHKNKKIRICKFNYKKQFCESI